MGNTELSQIGNLLRERAEGPWSVHRCRRMPRKPTDVQLIDHGSLQAALDSALPAPVEGQIAHHRAQSTATRIGRIGRAGAIPPGIGYPAGPGIEELLVRVKALATRLVRGPIQAPAVLRAGGKPLDEHMPRQ